MLNEKKKQQWEKIKKWRQTTLLKILSADKKHRLFLKVKSIKCKVLSTFIYDHKYVQYVL